MENYTISERLFSNNQASIWEVARKIIEEHYYPNNNAQAQSLTKGDDKTAYNRLVVSIRTKNSLPPNSQYIPIEKRNISIPSMSEFQSFIPNQEGTSQAGTYVIPSGLFSNNQASIWAVARKIIEEHYYPNNREQAELLITGQNKAPYNYLIVQIRQRNNLETKAEYISISKQSINIPTLSDFERQLIPGNTRQSSQTQINTAAAGTEKTIIVIDPGHGVRGTDGGSNMRWFDSGATNPPKATREKADYLESVITLDISQKLKLAIKNKIPNVEVFLTREKEIDLLDEKNYSEYTKISSTISKDKLSFRSEFALAKKADYFISIHCNDSPDSSASGFEILYHYKDVQNIRIAQSIISKQTIMTLRTETHKQQDAKVMRLFGNGNRSLENILIEIGFISNKGDVEKMTTKSTEIANEIAEGIKKYINEK